MAEGFEPYHVPQQSRRDKLRVSNSHPPPPPGGCVDNLHHHIQSCAPPLAVPLYDPSDLLTCAAAANVHRHGFNPLGATATAGVKEEGMNLMSFLGGLSTNHVYLDPQMSSVQLNPSSINQDINGNPYAYASLIDHHHQSYHQNREANSTNNNNNNNSGQSLSLSLSSHHNSNNLPLELNLQKYDFNNSGKVSGGGYHNIVPCKTSAFNSIEISKSTVPLGPFTGYASVLKGSRFLKPAQQLLEELCDMGRAVYAEKNGADPGLLDPPPLDHLSGGDGVVDDSSDGGEQTRKKSRLLSMLDEVYKRYKQYYQQMQAAVAAFESVAGLSSAAPFANLALKAMSKHFRHLKNAITDQLQFTSKSHGKIGSERDETQRVENSGKGSYGQRSFHSSGFVDPPVWRPQRGLPEHAVTVLRSWLFEHFLHPYPTDTDKLMLAKQTGLSRNQVSNWFINARVRLWKPMVEEIHMLETRQTQKSLPRDEQSPNTINDHLPTSRSIECENASTSIQRTTEFPSKRNRDDTIETSRGISQGPLKLPYNNLLHNHVGVSNAGGNGGVSLTLGLHQNGFGLSDSYPINAARRFGLDSHGEEYVVSGFTAQNRQLIGRGIMDGGQIMHDFVG